MYFCQLAEWQAYKLVVHNDWNNYLATNLQAFIRRGLWAFGFLSQAQRDGEDAVDLRELSAWLSRTPCGPLYKRHVSPDRELAALVVQHVTGWRGRVVMVVDAAGTEHVD